MYYTIDICKTKASKEVVVGTKTDYLSPFEMLKEIKEDWIANHNAKSVEMLFDMYYIHGHADNRFAKLTFNGTKFETQSYAIVPAKKVDKEISRI